MRSARSLVPRAVGASAAILAGIGILGAALGLGLLVADLRAGTPSGAGGPSSTATPAAGGVVIPWWPARDVPWVPPTPPPPLALRVCAAGDLVAAVGTGAAMGTSYTQIGLANRSASRCQLFGVPAVLALGPRGQKAATSEMSSQTHAGPVVLEPGRGALPAGEQAGDAVVRIAWAAWCGDDVAVTAFEVALPGGGSFQTPASSGQALRLPARCDLSPALPARTTLRVGPFEPSVYPPEPVPTPPPLVLVATIDAPARAVIGETLRYTVTLSNATTDAYDFGECPVFVHSLVKNWGRYRLNCEAVGSLAPGASATFEMLFSIDPERSSPDRAAQLRWHLEPFPNSAEAIASIALIPDLGPTPTPAAKPSGAGARR